MARPIELDLSDAIINIGNQVKAHRGLLCNVSNSMRLLVEEAERDSLAHSKSKRDSSAVHINLLEHINEIGSERGLVLWSGFLYGRPMSILPRNWPKDYNALDELLGLTWVHQLSLDYDYSDGEDASIDAIRDLFHHAQDLDWHAEVPTIVDEGTISMQVLADFVVYGKQGDGYTELFDGNIENIDTNDMREDMLQMSREQISATYKSLMRSSNELLKMFIQKGKNELAGIPAPDLMARCRYHTHAAKGLSCYLDK